MQNNILIRLYHNC